MALSFSINLNKNKEKIKKNFGTEIGISEKTWGNYYCDYMNSIEILLDSNEILGNRERSLLFMIRHAFELGLKEYIVFFCKKLGKNINLTNNELEFLCQEFFSLFEEMVGKFEIKEKLVKHFNENKTYFLLLKDEFQKVDNSSISLSYPANNQNTYFFKNKVVINIIEVMDLLEPINSFFLNLMDNIYTDSTLSGFDEIERSYQEEMKSQ